MKRKPALVAEDVEGFTASVLCGCGIILSLIQKGPGFLSAKSFKEESNAIHLEFRRDMVVEHRASRSCIFANYATLLLWQLLQPAHPRINSLHDRRGAKCMLELGEKYLAHRSRVHRLGDDLNG